ncbi:MAG: hypothetical protein KGO82_13200 [Bacteroidota bacterium]|nr:hypothetical protein [Bacteroidota bacterium]
MSIGIAVAIGMVRWKQIDPSYHPFIYNLSLSLLVEILNALHPYSVLTVETLNIFSIFDFLLFTWMFHNWGLFNYKKNRFYTVFALGVVTWTIVTFGITGFRNINNPFLILYSFALIAFSVTSFNKIVVQQRINIFRNAGFFICIGIMIFYSFFILTRATDLSFGPLSMSKSFKLSLQKIVVYTNLLANLLYAVAVIWVPRKKNITTLSLK